LARVFAVVAAVVVVAVVEPQVLAKKPNRMTTSSRATKTSPEGYLIY
jgi:hypothetical protein